MRRLVLLFVALITLAGCASESGAVGIGGSSLTMEELNELAASVGLVPIAEDPASVDANPLREVANVYVRDLALLDYLETRGLPTDGPLLEEARASVDRRIGDGAIGELDRDGLAYQAIVTNAFVAAQPPENYFEGELPGEFQDPPTIENIEQLQIQSVVANPLVSSNPEVQNADQLLEKFNDPEFVRQLLEDENVRTEVQFNKALARRDEIINGYGSQIFVESRLGIWDNELGQIVSR